MDAVGRRIWWRRLGLDAMFRAVRDRGRYTPGTPTIMLRCQRLVGRRDADLYCRYLFYAYLVLRENNM